MDRLTRSELEASYLFFFFFSSMRMKDILVSFRSLFQEKWVVYQFQLSMEIRRIKGFYRDDGGARSEIFDPSFEKNKYIYKQISAAMTFL